MQEYQDGTFGDIEDLKELLEKVVKDPAELEKTKAIHFGTKENLERLRDESHKEIDRDVDFMQDVEARLSRIETKMNKLLLHFGIMWVWLPQIEIRK